MSIYGDQIQWMSVFFEYILYQTFIPATRPRSLNPISYLTMTSLNV